MVVEAGYGVGARRAFLYVHTRSTPLLLSIYDAADILPTAKRSVPFRSPRCTYQRVRHTIASTGHRTTLWEVWVISSHVWATLCAVWSHLAGCCPHLRRKRHPQCCMRRPHFQHVGSIDHSSHGVAHTCGAHHTCGRQL